MKAELNLSWPPRTAREMEAWQNAYGGDIRIAKKIGISHKSVAAWRRKYDIAGIGKPLVRRVVLGTPLTEAHIADLYAGRTYDAENKR